MCYSMRRRQIAIEGSKDALAAADFAHFIGALRMKRTSCGARQQHQAMHPKCTHCGARV